MKQVLQAAGSLPRREPGLNRCIRPLVVPPGKVVAIVEDVTTTGGQIVLSTADLRAEGADVRHALVVVDKETGAGKNLSEAGLKMHSIFTARDLRAPGGRGRPRAARYRSAAMGTHTRCCRYAPACSTAR